MATKRVCDECGKDADVSTYEGFIFNGKTFRIGVGVKDMSASPPYYVPTDSCSECLYKMVYFKTFGQHAKIVKVEDGKV